MVKKIVTLFMVVVMLVSLTACGSRQGSTDKTGDGKTIKIAYLPITHSLAVLAEEAQPAMGGGSRRRRRGGLV